MLDLNFLGQGEAREFVGACPPPDETLSIICNWLLEKLYVINIEHELIMLNPIMQVS